MAHKRSYSRWWTALALAAVASLAARSAVSSPVVRPRPSVAAPSSPAAWAREAHIEGSAVRARAVPVRVMVPIGAHIVGRPQESIEAKWDGVLHRLWRWMTRVHMLTGLGN